MDQGGVEDSVVHTFSDSPQHSFFSMKLIAVLLVVVLVGIGSGYALAKSGGKLGSLDVGKIAPSVGGPGKGTVVGSDDMKTFKDIAEGKLENGGIEGEGQFHLVRPGGDSQNVYMTSSTVDLSQYLGKKVKVWGSTQTAQTAGWLMDVGRLEVLE